MENIRTTNFKQKASKKNFNNNNSNLKEKIIIHLELINSNPDNKYQIKIRDISNNISLEVKEEKNLNKTTNKFQSICDYYFGKEQNLTLEIKIKNKNEEKKYTLKTNIGQMIGNNNNNKNRIKIFKLNGCKEQIQMKVEQMKKKEKFLIICFKLAIDSNNEITEEEKYEYLKNEKYKFYFTLEKFDKILFESEVFTDDGKFNIIQIPIKLLDSDFDISFYSYKNRFGTITTNLNKITDQNNIGNIFFTKRLSMIHNITIYNHSFIREEITFLDYIYEKIRIGLSFGIDFTISNKPPNDKDSLHCITNENQRNPYERAILKCGNILGNYDYDQKFPVYGFGAVVNSKTSYCFNINFKDDPNITFVDNIIKYYHECLNKIYFSGPTYFAPIINKVINEIKIQNDPKEYQVLMILTDGIIQDLQNTIDSLVEGSFYPLSVIIIGIGNADFTKMEELDGDEIPLISRKGIKRQRDLVQFVPFNKYEGDENKLAYEVLEEIPRQVIEYYTLNYIFPETFNDEINKEDNNIFLNNIPFKTKNSADNIGHLRDSNALLVNSSFRLFDYKKTKTELNKNDDKNNNYSNVNKMFNIIKKIQINNICKSSRNMNINNLKKNLDNFSFNTINGY